MSAPAPRAPVSLTLGPTTVRFIWRHDRWAHEIVFPDGTTWQSVEGAAAGLGDPRWPASPVLVELSRLDHPSGPALLGVGLAGRSHFSASVGPDPAATGHLRFEIACRATEPPSWLGSTYAGPAGTVRILPGPAAVRLPATVRWGYDVTTSGFRPLPGTRHEPPPGGD